MCTTTLGAVCDALDRRNVAIMCRRKWRQAAQHWSVLATGLSEHNSACPAAPGVATDFGASEIYLSTNEIHEHL